MNDDHLKPLNKAQARFDLFMLEISLIQDKIKHFDNLRLRTKQLALVLWVAIVGYGLKDVKAEIDPYFFFLAIILPIPFWYIDASFRRRYKSWSTRISAIRKFVRDETYPIKVPGRDNVTFDNFLNPKTEKERCFPVLDFWAEGTEPKKELDRVRSYLSSVFNPKIFVFYYTMSALAAVIALKKTSDLFMMVIPVILIPYLIYLLSGLNKLDSKRKDSKNTSGENDT